MSYYPVVSTKSYYSYCRATNLQGRRDNNIGPVYVPTWRVAPLKRITLRSDIPDRRRP